MWGSGSCCQSNILKNLQSQSALSSAQTDALLVKSPIWPHPHSKNKTENHTHSWQATEKVLAGAVVGYPDLTKYNTLRTSPMHFRTAALVLPRLKDFITPLTLIYCAHLPGESCKSPWRPSGSLSACLLPNVRHVFQSCIQNSPRNANPRVISINAILPRWLREASRKSVSYAKEITLHAVCLGKSMALSQEMPSQHLEQCCKLGGLYFMNGSVARFLPNVNM